MFFLLLFRVFGTRIAVEDISSSVSISFKYQGKPARPDLMRDVKRLEIFFNYSGQSEFMKSQDGEVVSLSLTGIQPGAEITLSELSEELFDLEECDEILVSFKIIKDMWITLNESYDDVSFSIKEYESVAYISTIKNGRESQPLPLENLEEWRVYFNMERGTVLSFKNDSGLQNFTPEYLKLIRRIRPIY